MMEPQAGFPQAGFLTGRACAWRAKGPAVYLAQPARLGVKLRVLLDFLEALFDYPPIELSGPSRIGRENVRAATQKRRHPTISLRIKRLSNFIELSNPNCYSPDPLSRLSINVLIPRAFR